MDDVIVVTNPWSKMHVQITPDDVTQDRLDALVQFMDDDVREDIHREDDYTPFDFFRRYVEIVGPESAGSIWFS